jgi:hypothetical protein
MPLTNYLEAKTFLQTIYSVYSRNYDGLTELRFISTSATSRFLPKGEISPDDWAKVVELNRSHHAYFGVNPRPRNQAKKQDDIKDIICLWADVDGKDFDGGKDEALERVERFPIIPSIVVDSGHGYHAYWILREPIINLSEEARISFKKILAGLIKEVAGDKSKVNLDALLRLPGTLNLKDDPPKECRVISLSDTTYRLEDFARFRDETYSEPEPSTIKMPAFGSESSPVSRNGEAAARADVERLEIPAKTKRLIISGERLQDPAADHTRSARDYSIINSLIKCSYDYSTIKSIFYNPHLGCSDRLGAKPEKALQWDVLSALRKCQRGRTEASAPAPTPGAGERLRVRCTADIVPETTRWLWPDRFALGKLSLIVGDPESGKSLFTAWMASKVSSGEAWPDGTAPPRGKVAFLQCEDGVAETLVPRLIQYGADRHRVKTVDGVIMTSGEDRIFSLLTDLRKLEEFIRTEGDVKMIIIDPLQAYLGAGLNNRVNPHADAHIREVLTPVKALAEAHNVAIIGLVHLNKNAMADMMYRVGGSIALVGLPRSVWLMKWDRDPNGFRYFQSMKSNRKAGVKGLAFKIDRDRGDVTFHDDVEVPSAADLMAPSTDRRPREEAKAFIIERVNAGVRDSREIEAEAMQEGINRATLFAAKKELKIRSEKYPGVRGKWIWVPPSPAEGKKPEVSSRPSPSTNPEEKIATLLEQIGKEDKPQGAESLDSGTIEPQGPRPTMRGSSREKEHTPPAPRNPRLEEAIRRLPEILKASKNRPAEP